MVCFGAKLPDINSSWDRSLIFPQASKWLDLHTLAARLSTALANDFYDLEEQQRRSIGRVFRPALKLMHGVGGAHGLQAHGQADRDEKKSNKLKRPAALGEIAARF